MRCEKGVRVDLLSNPRECTQDGDDDHRASDDAGGDDSVMLH